MHTNFCRMYVLMYVFRAPCGEDFHDYISSKSKTPYILLCLKILRTVCVGYHCSNYTAAGCAYIEWRVLLLLLWKTLLTLSGVVDMSTLYLRRCAVAAFTSTSKSGQLRQETCCSVNDKLETGNTLTQWQSSKMVSLWLASTSCKDHKIKNT